VVDIEDQGLSSNDDRRRGKERESIGRGGVVGGLAKSNQGSWGERASGGMSRKLEESRFRESWRAECRSNEVLLDYLCTEAYYLLGMAKRRPHGFFQCCYLTSHRYVLGWNPWNPPPRI